MTHEYRLEHGSYYLYDFSKKPSLITKKHDIILMTDKIALCLDAKEGVLHKHGKPEFVLKWYISTRNKLIQNNFDEMANDLIYLEGSFDVEEINKCISCSGYVLTFYKNLIASAKKTPI